MSYSTWIEGVGTFRTLFRKLVLWDYASPNCCKRHLLLAVEKKKSNIGIYDIQFAVERRKREVQLIAHYIPLFIVFVPAAAYIMLATLLHVIPSYFAGLTLSASLFIAYSFTFFSKYVATCRLVFTAAEELFGEFTRNEVSPSFRIIPVITLPFEQAPFLQQRVNISPIRPLKLTKKTRSSILRPQKRHTCSLRRYGKSSI